MDLDTLLSYPWGIMSPEFTILGIATLLSLLDLFLKDKNDRRILAWLGLAGILLAFFFVLRNIGQPVQEILYDTYRLDGFANAFKLLFLGGVAIVFIMSLDEWKHQKSPYKGEFYYLMLAGLLGAMILASSADMITMFIGLELLSLSSYVLVAIRKKNLLSNESAFKYVVSGAIASAVMLYGMSFIYGLTGSTNLFEIANGLNFAFNQGYDFLVYFAFFLTFVGLSFKISAVPFHMWTSDVYQGAMTPVTAFLSVVSKAAGFAMILRFFLISFFPLRNSTNIYPGIEDFFIYNVSLFIAIVAAASMVVGNTLALKQTNMKRLFAYSSIAQAGYILVPFAVVSSFVFDTILYYLLAYLFMNLGAFAIIQSVIRQTGTEDIKGFAGLYHRAPFKALAMTVFLLSLAGLPITAGFFGKFYIFMGAINAGSIWLASVMVLTSVISYYYYFKIIRQMYMRGGESEAKLPLAAGIGAVVVICLAGTLLMGLVPTYVLEGINQNLNFNEIFEMVNR